MTYYKQLIKHIENVKEILTEKTWDKNTYYFSDKNNILCMTIDGAIQTQVNPEVKKIYEQYINKKIAALAAALTASPLCACRAAYAAARHAAYRAATSKDFSYILDLWINRENWIKEDCIENNKNYGNLDIHYLVGLTGLDYNFEEKSSTTLSMIKNKLDETINLIKQIEKYIIYV